MLNLKNQADTCSVLPQATRTAQISTGNVSSKTQVHIQSVLCSNAYSLQ
jgi:hypothetical protein